MYVCWLSDPLVLHLNALSILAEIDGRMAAAISRICILTVGVERGDGGSGLQRRIALHGSALRPGRGQADAPVRCLHECDTLTATDLLAQVLCEAGGDEAW